MLHRLRGAAAAVIESSKRSVLQTFSGANSDSAAALLPSDSSTDTNFLSEERGEETGTDRGRPPTVLATTSTHASSSSPDRTITPRSRDSTPIPNGDGREATSPVPKVDANRLTPQHLQGLTREQLISRISHLEKLLCKAKRSKCKKESDAVPILLTSAGNDSTPTLKQDFPTRHVALKIAYLGWDYLGFTEQVISKETVERHLFDALLKSKMVSDIRAAKYSRCGRTDRGVSAFSNVISLMIRTRLQPDGSGEEYSYIDILNRLLPTKIRVLAWAPVPDDFSARFSCTQRTYKYFLPRFALDLEAMRRACAMIVGLHDFRNFCKIDPTKPERSYQRNIFSATIEPCNISSDFLEITICGSGFLWHQIRCFVHIFVLIGQGLENESLLSELLDIDRNPRKPSYSLAPEYPLVLYDCSYEGAPGGEPDWQYLGSEQQPNRVLSQSRIAKDIQSVFEFERMRSLLSESLMGKILSLKLPADVATPIISAAGMDSVGQNPEVSLEELVMMRVLEPGYAANQHPWGQNYTLMPLLFDTSKQRKYSKIMTRTTGDSVEEKTLKRKAKTESIKCLNVENSENQDEFELAADAPAKRRRILPPDDEKKA